MEAYDMTGRVEEVKGVEQNCVPRNAVECAATSPDDERGNLPFWTGITN